MSIFADASALIAIIAREPDALDLAAWLDRDPDRLCSAVSAWETTAGLCRSFGLSPASARRRFTLFRTALAFRFVALGEVEYDIALDAYARFGKGRHSAGLNMGDCLAYACAKTNQAKLLYKGNDFPLTDIESALEAT